MSFPKFRNFQITEKRLTLRKTNVIFGLSTPKSIKKHQKIKIKKTRPKIRCPVKCNLLFRKPKHAPVIFS